MIPLKLRVKNFMCYRDVPEPLPLEGIHVACISGGNGHGKSALLDAITWALWGKARGKGVDELIHIGESDMEVELEFSNGEDVYRVVRKRKKARGRGSGASMLDLQVSGAEGGAVFRPTTGNTIPETQAQINRLIHLEYDTFVNSSFLRQGRADEFTLRTPRERKEVLADILNLSLYDEMETLARQKARDRDREAAQYEHLLREIDAEVSARPELEAELCVLNSQVGELEKRSAEHRQAVQDLTTRKIRFEAAAEELGKLKARRRGIKDDLSRTQADVCRHKTRLSEYRHLLSDADSLEERHARFQWAVKEDKRFSDALREHSLLTDRRIKLERQLDAERASLTARLERIKAESRVLEDKASRIVASEEGLANSAVKLADVDERLMDIAAELRHVEDTSVHIGTLESENRNLVEEMKELRKKVDLLAEGVSQCPTCGTSLAEAGIEHVRSALFSEGAIRRRKFDLNKAKINELTSLRDSGRTDLKKSQTAAEMKRRDIQAEASVLERDMREGEAASQKLKPMREESETLSTLLADETFGQDLRNAINELHERLKSLAYDLDAHQLVSDEVRSLEGSDIAWLKLQEARNRSEETQQDLSDAQKRFEELQSRLEDASNSIEGIEEQAAQLPNLVHRLREAESLLDSVNRDLMQQRDLLAGLRQRLQAVRTLEEKAGMHRTQLNRATRDKGIYEELARAFGKGGVQALIIETVIPEIEHEANRLLSRMTDNRMHVKIETQREKRTGGSIETLDINIADELGSRPYEMFSGGEAFRINFALRVAISRLLTRRAGTPLRILFIDEGFGTQDGPGREKLMDAIYSIQEDFDRIIVITHIDELKEAFPVHIQVVKTEQGSFFSVN